MPTPCQYFLRAHLCFIIYGCPNVAIFIFKTSMCIFKNYFLYSRIAFNIQDFLFIFKSFTLFIAIFIPFSSLEKIFLHQFNV